MEEKGSVRSAVGLAVAEVAAKVHLRQSNVMIDAVILFSAR